MLAKNFVLKLKLIILKNIYNFIYAELICLNYNLENADNMKGIVFKLVSIFFLKKKKIMSKKRRLPKSVHLIRD